MRKTHTRCDLRWLAALDLKIGEKLRVLLNEEHEKQFRANLELALNWGF